MLLLSWRLCATCHAQMLRSFGEGRMFFTAVFHPDDDKQNVVLAGCADKKVHQWDADTGDLVQVWHARAARDSSFMTNGCAPECLSSAQLAGLAGAMGR